MNAPKSYLVLNAWTEKVLKTTRSLDEAEDFYEAEIERNREDAIQLVAVLRESGT